MAKKIRKTAKKKVARKKAANNRGKWSTKPIVSLEFVNAHRLQKGGEFTKITKSGVYFSVEHAQKLGLNKNSFVLFARSEDKTGQHFFVANKPAGLFGGHKLSTNAVVNRKKGKGDRFYIALRAERLNFPLGQYDLGKSVRTALLDHRKKEVRFEAFQLIPL